MSENVDYAALHMTFKSPKSRAGFKTVLQDLEKSSVKVPVMDNDTRWGSVATMVEYGLENSDGIDMYCCEQVAL